MNSASSDPDVTSAATAWPALRSLLFVPGNKPSWTRSAVNAGADAVILDLEDAVPVTGKAAARDAVVEVLASWRGEVPIFVRVNPLTGIESIAELRAIVQPQVAGVVLPKVSSRADIVLADRLIGWCEAERGLPPKSVALVPLLETPQALWDAHGIARTADRIAYLGALTARGGDVERSVGFRWTEEGTETLALRSLVLLAARAAGTHNPVSGLWTDIENTSGLQQFAEATRQIGYEGMLAIHPSHIAIINRAFTLGEHDIDRYQRIVAAFADGSAAGSGAVVVDGTMVDEAMAVTARQRLDGASLPDNHSRLPSTDSRSTEPPRKP